MAMRFLTASAVTLLVAGPAFADCSQEIESLNEAVTRAETGASSSATGLPATQHQEQVLASDQQGEGGATGTGVAGQADMPASPHQQEVLARDQEGDQAATGTGVAGQADMPASPHQEEVLAGGGDAASAQQATELVAQAGDMAEAGNEEGCMQKVTEAKDLLGID